MDEHVYQKPGLLKEAVFIDEASLHPGLNDSPAEVIEKLAIAEEVELMIQLAKRKKIPMEYGEF